MHLPFRIMLHETSHILLVKSSWKLADLSILSMHQLAHTLSLSRSDLYTDFFQYTVKPVLSMRPRDPVKLHA